MAPPTFCERCQIALKAGNEAEYGRTFLPQYDHVFRYAYRMTHDRQVAKEIVSDVELLIVKKAGQESFQDEMALRRWMIRIAVNLCRRHFAEKKKNQRIRTFDETTPVADRGQSAEGAVETIEALEVVRRAIETLSEVDQSILAMIAEKCTGIEIASVLEVGEGAARSRCKNARDRLHAAITRIDPELGRRFPR